MRTPQLKLLVMLVMASTVACSEKVSEVDSSDGDAVGGDGGDGGDGDGGDGGSDGDDGSDGSDGSDGDGGDGGDDGGDTPVVTLNDAFCTVYVSGETRAVWSVFATASDPQGADTLERVVEDGVVLLQDESEVGRYALNCVVADLSRADCSGTFSALGDGTSCDAAPSYAVMVEAVDEDGNRGASDSLTGRVE